MKKLLALVCLFVTVSVLADGLSISPGLNPLSLGPIGGTNLSLSGSLGINEASSTSGANMFQVVNGANTPLQIMDGFGVPRVYLANGTVRFDPSGMQIQGPITIQAANALGLTDGYGAGNTFLSRQANGVLSAGTTAGGTDGTFQCVQVKGLAVLTGTLASGSATISNAILAGTHPWVQDTNTVSLTNVGSLAVSLSGTTATIKSSNTLDTSTFDLHY